MDVAHAPLRAEREDTITTVTPGADEPCLPGEIKPISACPRSGRPLPLTAILSGQSMSGRHSCLGRTSKSPSRYGFSDVNYDNAYSGASPTRFSAAQTYSLGESDGDNQNDDDFLLIKSDFNSAIGIGSFERLLTGVHLPCAVATLLMGFLLMGNCLRLDGNGPDATADRFEHAVALPRFVTTHKVSYERMTT